MATSDLNKHEIVHELAAVKTINKSLEYNLNRALNILRLQKDRIRILEGKVDQIILKTGIEESNNEKISGGVFSCIVKRLRGVTKGCD